jgi:hypothetical protein
MAKKVPYLSPEALALLREIAREYKNTPPPPGIGGNWIDDPHQAPEVYLAQTPGGGIAARSGTTVSSASCTIWRNINGTLESTGITLTVYNFATTAIGATKYIIVNRDKQGTWWVVAADC